MNWLRVIGLAVGLLLIAPGSVSASDAPTADEIDRINALLAEMQCEMDEDDIEKEGDGFDLDDVLCVDGQYDIKLDADYNIVEKRAE